MGKIFCLMGKSSTGKDTVFEALKEDVELGLKPIIPYTTRPMRDNEKRGVNYFFIDEEELDSFVKQGKVIERREYNTVKGLWCYCTIDDGQIDVGKNNYLLIATLEAFIHIENYFGSNTCVPIYLAVDDGLRLERALNREKQQQNPNYIELCRRFVADDDDFSEEKLVATGITKVYYNNNLQECIGNIKKEIEYLRS